MAEAVATAKGTVAGWIKGGFTAVFGLVWGAVLMYVSPLVSNVIKPAKPVANFSIDQGQGLQVAFQNRSVGATDGWWDFGDGSALEPFSASQQTLPHTYARPGVYTAKLAVHNLLGDESERTVNVNLDGSSPTAGVQGGGSATDVADLIATPARSDTYAPATFRLTAKVNNADLCVWAFDDRPLQLTPNPPASQNRYITFREPGKHTIKLAAVRGKQVVEKSVTVQVTAPPAGLSPAMAVVNVTYEAVQVETKDVTRNVAIELPRDMKSNSQPYQKEVLPATGFKITKAILKQPVQHPGVKDVKLALGADGKLTLSCELVKFSNSADHSSHRPVAILELIEERHGAPTQQVAEPMVAALKLPGSTVVQMPPPPQGWESKQHKVSFDLLDGQRTATQHNVLPVSGTVMMQNQTWQVTATEVGDQVRIDVTAAVPAAAGTPPRAN